MAGPRPSGAAGHWPPLFAPSQRHWDEVKRIEISCEPVPLPFQTRNTAARARNQTWGSKIYRSVVAGPPDPPGRLDTDYCCLPLLDTTEPESNESRSLASQFRFRSELVILRRELVQPRRLNGCHVAHQQSFWRRLDDVTKEDTRRRCLGIQNRRRMNGQLDTVTNSSIDTRRFKPGRVGKEAGSQTSTNCVHVAGTRLHRDLHTPVTYCSHFTCVNYQPLWSRDQGPKASKLKFILPTSWSETWVTRSRSCRGLGLSLDTS